MKPTMTMSGSLNDVRPHLDRLNGAEGQVFVLLYGRVIIRRTGNIFEILREAECLLERIDHDYRMDIELAIRGYRQLPEPKMGTSLSRIESRLLDSLLGLNWRNFPEPIVAIQIAWLTGFNYFCDRIIDLSTMFKLAI